MTQPEKQLTEKESLDLIAQMINKAKDACHDTGIAAIMWGAVIAVCSLVRLSELHFDYKLPFDIYLLTFVAIVPQIYFSVKGKKERKVKAYGDAFMDYLWVGFGICIFLIIYITGTMYREWEPVADEYKKLTGHSSSFKMYEFTSSFFLLLYGLPTFVTGVSMKFKPMLWGGLLCWICCIITLYTSVKVDLILTAVSSVFAWLIPGIIMEKEYRNAKRGLARANV
jgi:hypothetical protein